MSSNIKLFLTMTGVLFLSASLILSGSGLINTLFSLKLEARGYSSFVIGLIAAVYFAGMLFGALRSSVLINLVGYVKSFSTLAAAMAITSIIPGIEKSIYLWGICRFVQGFSLSGLFIIIETWILASFSDKSRGKGVAMYMTIIYGSYSFGQFFLFDSAIKNNSLFFFSAVLMIASIIPMSSFPVTPPMIEENVGRVSFKKIFNSSSIGLFGCLISGILLSSITSIFPIYLGRLLNNTSQVAISIAISFIFGVLVQYPLGILSDRFERQKIQILLNLWFSILLILFLYIHYTYMIKSIYIIMMISAIVGVFSFSIYPISMNIICDNLTKSELMHGVEFVMISYGIGCIIGPIYTATFMAKAGTAGYLISYLILTSILTILTAALYKRKKLVRQIPVEEIMTPFVPHSPMDVDTVSSLQHKNKKINQ